MTPEDLNADFLSLRAYLLRVVLRSTLILTIGLFVIIALKVPSPLSDTLAFIGAAACVAHGLHRAIDVLAYRMTHDSLMRKSERAYRAALAAVETPPRRFADVGLILEWAERELGVATLRR